MPRKLTEAETKDKWNFYVDKLLKARYVCKIKELGLVGKQSAVLRALMDAFVDGRIDIEMLKSYIDKQTLLTPNGKTSKL